MDQTQRYLRYGAHLNQAACANIFFNASNFLALAARHPDEEGHDEAPGLPKVLDAFRSWA